MGRVTMPRQATARSAKQIASIIENISEKFDLRFQITRAIFRRELTNTNILTDVFLNEIGEECINFGFFLIINLHFALIE
jgi:hypothetical protein